MSAEDVDEDGIGASPRRTGPARRTSRRAAGVCVAAGATAHERLDALQHHVLALIRQEVAGHTDGHVLQLLLRVAITLGVPDHVGNVKAQPYDGHLDGDRSESVRMKAHPRIQGGQGSRIRGVQKGTRPGDRHEEVDTGAANKRALKTKTTYQQPGHVKAKYGGEAKDDPQ